MPPRGDRVPVPSRCNNVLQVRQCAPFDHAMPCDSCSRRHGRHHGTLRTFGKCTKMVTWGTA